MDSDTTRTCFVLWLVPVHHVAGCEGLERVKLFINAIVCFSKNGEYHVRVPRRFLERLTRFNLKLAPNKALLGAAEIIFYGNRISSEGVGPDPGKFKAMSEMPMPQNVSQLRLLLGALSYYKRQLPEIAARTRPLNSLLRKGAKFEFSPHQWRIVLEILNELSSPNVWPSQISKPLLQCQENSGSLRIQAQTDSVW